MRMFQSFFTELRAAKIPVTIREYLTLIEGVDKGVAIASQEPAKLLFQPNGVYFNLRIDW